MIMITQLAHMFYSTLYGFDNIHYQKHTKTIRLAQPGRVDPAGPAAPRKHNRTMHKSAQ